MINIRKLIATVLMFLLLVTVFTGCNQTETKVSQKIEDFENAKIGIMTGSSHDGTVKQFFPNAERVYFSTVADMVLAVAQGKIDCYIEDAPFLPAILWEGGNNLMRLAEPVKQVDNGFAFPQHPDSAALREQVNAFISDSKADGTIEMLKTKWLGATEPTDHPDYTTLTGENGTIHLAVVVESKPMVYLHNDRCTGFEIELLTLFAQQYGYSFEIEEVPFNSVVAGIASGKYDMASASLNITPEREESVDFSDPYSAFDTILVVRSDDKTQQTGNNLTLADFENATIGILSGSSFDPLTKERFPNAQRLYYSLVPDMVLAVEQGKIDGYLSETTYLAAAIWEGAKIEPVNEIIDRTNAGFIFQQNGPNAAVREQLNAFIRDARDTGLLDDLQEKWLGGAEPEEIFDADSLTGENGTLKVAISPDLKPLGYIKDGNVTGYEVEVLQHFAKEYGYQLEFSTMTFDAILPGLVAGRYDIGAGGMTITEERAKSVDFSESYLTVDVVMVVKAQESVLEEPSFWQDVREDFQKTFIREDRWKMIVEGIGITMLISISAAICGTLLGFGLYMLSRSDVNLLQILAKGIAKVYARIVSGTPVVVILMILFYVVFAQFRDMSGILVAIIGFTLTFGAFVYDHMTVSVNSVDRGQTEAAYALGYTKNQTFFRIIFPQAMSIFLPSYSGQAVELIKATAVVGYVAVNDLTKVGDIIRSNTYEAFFPLIATAVIYFLLTWMLSWLLGFVKRSFEPKRRSKEDILKGVKTV